MPDESAADGGESLRERVSELEQLVEQQQATIQRLMPSRRQTVAGLGLLGAGVGAGRLSTEAARAEAAGQVGTDTDPVDVKGYDVRAANSIEDASGTSHTGELAEVSDLEDYLEDFVTSTSTASGYEIDIDGDTYQFNE